MESLIYANLEETVVKFLLIYRTRHLYRNLSFSCARRRRKGPQSPRARQSARLLLELLWIIRESGNVWDKCHPRAVYALKANTDGKKAISVVKGDAPTAMESRESSSSSRVLIQRRSNRRTGRCDADRASAALT